MIPIIIKFGELLLCISLRIIDALRSCIKHLSVSSDIQTLRSWLKKMRLTSQHFSEALVTLDHWSSITRASGNEIAHFSCLDISDETLFLVFDILLNSTLQAVSTFSVRRKGQPKYMCDTQRACYISGAPKFRKY